MKKIFINSMSRNGSSLAYEIIAQYFPLKLYPARIDFACSQEEFWPLNCKSGISLNDFFNKLINKHYLEKGSNIENYIHSNIQTIQEFDINDIKKKFLEKAFLYKKVVCPETFDCLLEEVYSAVRKKVDPEREESLDVLLLQEDHSFHAGEDSFKKIFSDTMYIQTIRNFLDVIASRKRMLLIHKKNFSSPLASTLTSEAIFSEAKRWVWSFVCAFLNKRHSNYKVYFFEKIKADPSYLLEEISLFIKVNPSPTKARVLNKPLKIGMMGVTPSIDFFTKKPSQNKSGTTIDAYKLTLNQWEIKEILLIFNKFPEILYEKELFFSMFEKHIKDLMVAFDLNGWYALYINRELKQLMIEYSSLNYGHKNCNLAFSDEPV